VRSLVALSPSADLEFDGGALQNQMHEALMLFDSICNSQWFVKTSMVSQAINHLFSLCIPLELTCIVRRADPFPE
jgi:hypothetical protein